MSNIVKFQLGSISKILIPNFVCVLTKKRYKTYQTEFSFCHLGHAPVVGLRGAWGGGVKNLSMGICDGAQRLRILVQFTIYLTYQPLVV